MEIIFDDRQEFKKLEEGIMDRVCNKRMSWLWRLFRWLWGKLIFCNEQWDKKAQQ